ncbi:MAG: APC family permease [Thaumarchaeota archaeon]|nr:APC family permease [Nitrososphaerota archaeon]
MEKQAKTFARDATGLVRTLGFLDQFIISQAIIVVVNGFVLTFLFAPVFFPGANLALVFTLGSIPAFAMSYVYAKMSAGMPRSGGDYVWSTRILGPVYGSVQFVFLLITTLIVGITLSTWSNVSIALSQLIYALGVTTGNSGWVSFAMSLTSTGLGAGYAIATFLVILYIVISIFGLRIFAWFQRAGLALYYLSTAGFIGILLLIDPNTIPALFNKAMSAAGGSFTSVTYNSIIAQAGPSPSDWITPSVLAAIPWGFLTFTGFNFGAYLAGETRNVKSSMWRSLFISVIVTVLLLISMAFLVYRDFGINFINALSSVQANSPSTLPTLPTTSLLASLGSPAAAVFVGLSLLIGWLIVCVAYIVTISRMIFAASFDRLLPNSLAGVSDRFHSPRNAVLVAGVLSWIFVTLYFFTNFFSTYLQLGLIAPIGYLMPLLAAMVFAWRKKDLFKSTVGQFANSAALGLAALVGVGSFLFYIVALSVPLSGPLGTVFLGGNLNFSYGVVIGTIIIGLVIYAAASSHAKGIGVDLGKVYSEIPPE